MPLKRLFIAAFRNLRASGEKQRSHHGCIASLVNQCITKQRRAKVRSEAALDDEEEKDAASFAAPSEYFTRSGCSRTRKGSRQCAALLILSGRVRQVVVMKEFEELTFSRK